MSDVDYSQPDFYRFNEDSLGLVTWVKGQRPEGRSILDLGAGSGIIGIELARHFRPRRLTLLELQQEYLVHLQENVRNFLPPGIELEILIQSFSDFVVAEKFDLIVVNPPYYLPGKGELSADPRRALARSFLHDSWDVLLEKISSSLSEIGICFIVLKKDPMLLKVLGEKARKNSLQMDVTDAKSVMYLKLLRLNVD